MRERLFRYKIEWVGLYDGPRLAKRILTLRAKNKPAALACHEKLFPAATRKIERIKQ